MIKKYRINIFVSVTIAVLGIYGLYPNIVQESAVAINSSETGKQRQVIVTETDDTAVFPITTETKSYGLSEEQVEMVENIKNEPVLVVKTGKEISDQTPIESASNYDNSVAKMIQLLNDPSNGKEYRQEVAKVLIKSGSGEGALSVLKAIINTHVQEDYVFKENLLQIFADVNSVEAAELLTDVLTGKAPYSSDLTEIPDDITYAVKNAIRLMPNESVGKMLSQKYYNETLEENQKILLDINHPVMIARLMADAFGQGDNETADRLMEELAGDEDNLAIKGMMMLAREKSIPLDNVAHMLSFWTLSNEDNDQAHFSLVEYLGNVEFSPEERSLAANAIANEKDKEMAVSALKKAQLFEEDPLVQEYIKNALSRITDDAQPEMTDDAQPEMTDDAQPEMTDDAQPEMTDDAQPEMTDDAQPEMTDEPDDDTSRNT